MWDDIKEILEDEGINDTNININRLTSRINLMVHDRVLATEESLIEDQKQLIKATLEGITQND